MGVEPFPVASSLLGVVAQRLVRRLCPDCKAEYIPTDAELTDLGLARSRVPKAWRPVGCKACHMHGYRGRLGIYEFLPAFDEVKTLVMKNVDAGAIKRKAVELGMSTLRDDGINKALAGVTSFDEIVRATRDDTVEV
jgi:general secretion pathway protein E